MTAETKLCYECGTSVTACPEPCGLWDCAYHSHLYAECPSEVAGKYRNRRRRDAERREKAFLARGYTQEDLARLFAHIGAFEANAFSVRQEMGPWVDEENAGGPQRFSLDSWDQVHVNGRGLGPNEDLFYGFVNFFNTHLPRVETSSLEATKAECDRLCREAGWTLLDMYPDADGV